MRKRRLTEPWPFLYSVLPGRGLVQTLPPKTVKPKRLRKVPPSSSWVQPELI